MINIIKTSISSTTCADKEHTISATTPCSVIDYENKNPDSSTPSVSAEDNSDQITTQSLSQRQRNISSQNAVISQTCNLTKTNSSYLKEYDTLLQHGYKKHKFIAKSLQGQIFTAKKVDTDEYVVIKTANMKLHQSGIAITNDGRTFRVKENIFKEAMMMKKFMKHNPPSSCIKYYGFFWDKTQFYLVMEKGGKGLFEFTVECHEWIKKGKLSIKEWRKTVRFIFAKMVEFIDWMHNTVHCCHLDVSLENVVLGNDTYFDEKEERIKNLEIRFIDFGLTEPFNKDTNPYFICNQFVGKNGYKSPQSYAKQTFNANKADIWSLGVCLFMMICGAAPYKTPNSSDAAFNMIKNGKIKQLLSIWTRSTYIVPHLLDLLLQMLCDNEQKRINIDEICKHIWLKPYLSSNAQSVIIQSDTMNQDDDACLAAVDDIY